jgi:hypothetical protein
MVDSHRLTLRRLWVMAAAGLAVAMQSARAQEEAEALAQPVPDQQASMTREQFHQWIDQVALGSEDGLPVARTDLETVLDLKIEYLERTCAITAMQKRKLQLAGRGDIKRFFDRVADHRQRYEEVKDSQQELGKLETEIQSLAKLRGKPMFEEGSIFKKTLSRLLSADQTARIEAAARQSRSFRHRAKVDLFVQSLDIVAGLSDRQRERLTELLLRETRPARNSFVDFDVEIVIAQTAELPESKIRPIFDRDQWHAVAPVLQALKQSYQETLHDVELAPDDEVRQHSSASADTLPATSDPKKCKGK